MPKYGSTSNLMYRIGTFRSGVAIIIPDNLSTNSISTYLQSFILADQIDLLCVTEYLMLKNERLKTSNQEAKNVALLNENLRKLLDDPIFSSGLSSLRLTDSTAFVRFGSRLYWPTEK